MKATLKRVIEETDTRAGRLFDLGVQTLIALSLVAFTIETLPNLPTRWVDALWLFEVACLSLFCLEYLLRVYVATPRRAYVLSFFGIVDLVAILPFLIGMFIGLGLDLRSVRSFRLLRFFRILKLTRYSAAVRRFHRALMIAWEEIVLFLAATGIVLFLAATGIYHFEHATQPDAFASIFHSLWWAVATLTTVGYGDVYPVTVGGRVFTFVILLVGLGVISFPAGLVASALAKAREIEEDGEEAAQQGGVGDEAGAPRTAEPPIP